MTWEENPLGWSRSDEQVHLIEVADRQRFHRGWLAVLTNGLVLGWRKDLDQAKLLGEAWPEGLEELVPDEGKWKGSLT